MNIEFKMDKSLLYKALIAELSKNLEAALDAAKATYDIATHEDNKAENKYDTRGLEASYLAGAQAARVRDLKETLSLISSVQFKNFSAGDKIAHTALVLIESEDKETWLLLLPKGGGQSIFFAGKSIKVVTPESPLGAILLGKNAGDQLVLNGKEYTVAGLY